MELGIKIELYNLKNLRIFLCAILCCIISFSISGQNIDFENELQKGISAFINVDFETAFHHLEPIAIELDKYDLDMSENEVSAVIYALCGMSASRCNKYNVSIHYIEKSLKLKHLPAELKVQCLNTQLINYETLNYPEFYQSTINKMVEMFHEYKSIDIFDSIIAYLFHTGKYNEIIKYEDDLKQLLIPQRSGFINGFATEIIWNSLYMEFAHSYKEIGNIRKANEFLNLLFYNCEGLLSKTKNYVIENFKSLSQRDRMWEMIKQPTENIEELAFNYPHYMSGQNDISLLNKFGELAYNTRLFKKGLLLNSTKKLYQTINLTNDSRIIELKDSISVIATKINTLHENKEYLSALNDLNRLRNKLIDRGCELVNFTDFTSIEWIDVQNNLSTNEVAIEFFSYPVQTGKQYAAVWISQNSSPKLVTLFYDEELEKYEIENNIYDHKDIGLYNLIWGVLESIPEINSAQSIYLSTDGILNVINIENLKDAKGHLASEKWNLYRLSSTRELVLDKQKSSKDNAVLYGGLKYEMDKDSLVAVSRSGNYHPISTTRALPIGSLRYGVKDLPESLNEVNNIANLFSGRPTLITGNSGTEESFKALEGSNYDIIHLATHGFFWSNNEADTRDYVNFLNNSNFQELTTEENAMLRSGLVFSGANIGLMGKELPDDVEDGVLTAKELSTMNLGNVDMVIMSACESGLGEISGEGVFGLQRGFKLAGANTLLMSLWKVDDKATCELMIEFYKHYLSGKSKQESLRLAQLKLRNSEEYSDPEYWAAFILLDALN